MRLVIDARPLSQVQAGGFKSYVNALVTGLRERADAGAANESVVLYVDRPLSHGVSERLPPNTEVRNLPPNRIKSDLYYFARQVRLDAPDVVMGTANYLPLGLPRHMSKVVTIHDAMGIKAYPWDVGIPRTFRERFINRYWAFLTRLSSMRAKFIVTVSNGSARELIHELRIPTERCRVIYNGIVKHPANAVLRDASSLLVIESPDPRKNTETVYRALPEVCDRLQWPFCLRIVCNGARAERRVRDMLESRALGNRRVEVELLVGLTDKRLGEEYARSSVFVWPSRFEGFGLPPLEAMHNGCAVVSSSAPVMPEILGEIPIYADPDRADEFADGIVHLLANDAERMSRGTRGHAHAAAYTCRRMVDETSAVWREAAG